MPVTLTQIRKVQWGRSFDWELKFLTNDLPKDFTSWFPAVEVDLGLFDISSQSFDLAHGSVHVPRNRNENNIRITFLDNMNCDLEKWLFNWGNSIKPLDGGLLTLEESVKRIFINKLSVQKTLVKSYSFLIYPEGIMQDTMNNQSSQKAFSQDFKVVGGGPIN